jgi:hypothetical protein
MKLEEKKASVYDLILKRDGLSLEIQKLNQEINKLNAEIQSEEKK